MRFTTLSAIGLLAIRAVAAPAPATHNVHERRDIIPRTWVKRSRVSGEADLPVRIGLTQRNLDKAHDWLMEVSSHDSPRYGKHYTAEEVNDIFAPAETAVTAVKSWLVSAGIAIDRISQSANKQWIQIDMPAAELESLLHTEYHFFEHTPTGRTNIAADQYHVPAHVQEHVDYITPGVFLYAPKKSQRTVEKRTFGVTGNKNLSPPLLKSLPATIEAILATAPPAGCDTTITPACIAALYNITAATKSAPGNSLGIFEDLGDIYSQTDLTLFFATVFPKIPIGTSPTLNGIDGATAPAFFLNAGPESDLDFQISYPIIYPQKATLFQTDDNYYQTHYIYEGFLNNFLSAIDGSYCAPDPLDPPYPDPNSGGYKGKLQCGVYKPTNVISISYGGQEADLPASYQIRQCNEFMKLGMQGVSVVLASGDSGVAGPAGDDSADGCLGTGQIFSPDFPATCPYITTVGATYLPTGANVATDSEVAVTRFPSGGGFSNIYPQPSYQQAAVSTYLTQHTPPYASYASTNNNSFGAGGGIYNRLGRGYPDVSAVGDNILIYNKAMPTLIGGTSASAPVWGAILTRINEERIAAGKSTIGFVNPVLYAHPGVMHDITTGSNPGCGTNGFAASSGWDPLTGLGTPNYPALVKLFLSLA